jgi:putative transposase
MPQSLANLAVHIVFSVKDRRPLLEDADRDRFHAYAIGTLDQLDCPCIEINSEPDHVHLLCNLARTMSVADLLEKFKASTSKWIKKLGPPYAGFSWQGGYAVFAVSQSQVELVRNYIRRQQEHHRGSRALPFQDELRVMLTKHGVSFDERYVWD